jgi:hypothetical protein
MDQFLDAWSSPRLNPEETKPERPITSNEIESVVRGFL